MARARSLSIAFQASSVMALTDKVKGRFLGGPFEQAVAEVNSRAAVSVQEGMVEALRKSIKATGRKQRGGERLEKSLLDEGNRKVTSSGFSVLNARWMNQSPAKLYWRRIEEGDKATFGSYILFTNDFSRFSSPFSAGGAREGSARQMRMPQHKGVYVPDIGPYPAYAYTAGGKRAFRRFAFAQHYRVALKNVGIDFDTLAH